jgi:hypothetical protein
MVAGINFNVTVIYITSALDCLVMNIYTVVRVALVKRNQEGSERR